MIDTSGNVHFIGFIPQDASHQIVKRVLHYHSIMIIINKTVSYFSKSVLLDAMQSFIFVYGLNYSIFKYLKIFKHCVPRSSSSLLRDLAEHHGFNFSEGMIEFHPDFALNETVFSVHRNVTLKCFFSLICFGFKFFILSHFLTGAIN